MRKIVLVFSLLLATLKIQAVDLFLSSPTNVPVASICTGSVNDTIAHFQIVSSMAGTTPLLTGVIFNAIGTFTPSDIANFSLRINTTNNFSTSTQVGLINSGIVNGVDTFFLTPSQSLTPVATYHFWICTSLAVGAVNNHTIQLDILDASTDFIFSTSASNFTGATSSAGLQTIKTGASANAGSNITTCSNSGATNITSGATAANNSGVTWSTSGTGTFTNNTSITTATYTPSAADTIAGTVTLTLTATGNPPCGNVTSNKTITINRQPTANAGSNVTTCASVGAVNITTGSTATNNSGISWSTPNGTGVFANNSSLTTATYTPSAADITAGSVTIRLTSVGNSPCANAVSNKTLTITSGASANAGSNITTCSNSGAINITSGATAVNNSGVTWSTSGTGTFTNNTSLTTATYTPSAADTIAGTITLTLTATGNPPCGNATSNKTLTINRQPTANAGSNVTTCSSVGAVNITTGSTATNNSGISWSTPNGTGVFANNTSLTTATYTPSAADITAGSVTIRLTSAGNSPCANAVSNKTLTITSGASANAGSNITTCSNSGAINITGGATAANNSGITWSTPNGTGTFTNNTSLTTATYTPSAADTIAGTVTIRLTAAGNPPCGNATSNKTLTINRQPTANAGSNVTTCSSVGAVNITTGSTATNNSGISWSTPNGTGTFTNNTSLTTATYTPSAADITAGSVTIRLTSSGNSPCANAVSNKTLTITLAATANAGLSDTTCSNSGAINITGGATTANNSGVTWSTPNGTGTFTNNTSLTTATYTPSAADINAGSVTIRLTATGNSPCTNAVSNKTLVITKLPTATINYSGNPFCTSVTTAQSVTLNGTSAFTGGQFTSGTGLSINSISGAIVPSTSNPGNYTVLYTIPALNSCPTVLVDTNVTIKLKPSIAPTNNSPLCTGNTLTLFSNATGGNGVFTYSWTGPNAFASNLANPVIPSSSLNVTGNYSLTVISDGCSVNSNPPISVTVAQSPPLPSISSSQQTAQISNLCSGTRKQNLNLNIDPNINQYTYSSPDLIFPDSVVNSPNMVFNAPETNIPFTTSLIITQTNQFNCSSSTTIPVNINPNSAPDPADIIPKNPGQLLIYLDNAVESYQWGCDDKNNLQPSFFSDQIFQVFVPNDSLLIAGVLDTVKYYYWVLVTQDSCHSKVYYNGPYKNPRKITEQIVPDEITSTILPNPNNGNFDFNLSGKIYGQVDLRIFNSIGQLVSFTQHEKTLPSENFSIRLSRLNQGLYFIKVSDVYGERLVSKLLIR